MKKITRKRCNLLHSRICGFSLVELLVTLIIVSLIMSVLAPVITKKLAASNITIGANVQNNATPEVEPEVPIAPTEDDNDDVDPVCMDGPSKECCEKLGALYLSSEIGYTGTPMCFSKFNAGDMDFLYYAPNFSKFQVTVVAKGTECKTDLCCWVDASEGTENSTYKLYPAIKRTLCEQDAGAKICQNWAPPGSKKGSWRLPTQQELGRIATLVNAETKENSIISRYSDNGLNFCDSAKNTLGSGYCKGTSTCKGAGSNYCRPSMIMALSEESGMLNKTPFILSSGTMGLNSANTYAQSVRCVTTAPQVSTVLDEEKTYHPEENEPEEQADCPDGTMFIHKKYTGNKNLCMFRHNMAINLETVEDDDFASKYGIQIVPSGTTCNLASTGMCCWYGTTSGKAEGSYKYSGAKRILCMQQAGETFCNKYSKKKGQWRLPTEAELIAMSPYITAETANSYFLSKYVPDDRIGLQLCDNEDKNHGTNRCMRTTCTNYCKGAGSQAYSDESACSYGHCQPARVATQGTVVDGTSTPGNTFVLAAGVFKNSNDQEKTYARSIRCVADDLTQRVDPEHLTETVENEPRNQADCPENTTFIDKYYTKGERNICMFNFNAGELSNGTVDELIKFAPRYGIQINTGGTSCNLSSAERGKSCCWITSTSGKAEGSNPYSGANRVVCMQEAGDKFCKNYIHYKGGKGQWRLPTEEEFTGLANWITASTQTAPFLSKYIYNGGLQLCDNEDKNHGTNRCMRSTCTNNCGGAGSQGYSDESACSYGHCQPARVATDKNTFVLAAGVFKNSNDQEKTYARSIRCVADDLTVRNYPPPEGEPPEGNPPDAEPMSQTDCPADTIFIAKKYIDPEGKNACMFAYNLGDETTATRYSSWKDGVSVVATGVTCSGEACCWQGATGTGGTEKYTYKATKRTVCNKAAGQKICSNLGEGWRLPTEAELKNLSNYITASTVHSPFLSKYVNNGSSNHNGDGIQLCDGTDTSHGSNLCKNTSVCKGAESNNCRPANIMSQGANYRLAAGNFTIEDAKDYAVSVRCVTNRKKTTE